MVAVPTIQPNIRARRALSVVTTVAFDGKLSVAEVSIETGRTHQIRVHLQVGLKGTEDLVDYVYGCRSLRQKCSLDFNEERGSLKLGEWLLKQKHWFMSEYVEGNTLFSSTTKPTC